MSRSKQANRNAYLAWKERTDTKDYRKKLYANHKQKIHEREKEARINLKSYIIRKYLINAGWKPNDITPELIEIKRQQIILKRLLNEKLQ